MQKVINIGAFICCFASALNFAMNCWFPVSGGNRAEGFELAKRLFFIPESHKVGFDGFFKNPMSEDIFVVKPPDNVNCSARPALGARCGIVLVRDRHIWSHFYRVALSSANVSKKSGYNPDWVPIHHLDIFTGLSRRDPLIRAANVNSNLASWRLTAVDISESDYRLHFAVRSSRNFDGEIRERDIGAYLSHADVAGDFHYGISGFISLACLDKHSFGVLCGLPSFFQSALYEPNARACDSRRYCGDNDHKQRPQSHVLLGIQILYFVFSGLVLIGGSLLCYKLADRGYNFAKQWGERIGFGCVMLVFSVGPLSIGGLLYLGYWLSFGTGRFLLLG